MSVKSIRYITALALVIIVSTYLNYEVEATTVDYNIKVIMVIVNRIDFNDLEKMPYTRSLINKSSIGLMNTRGSGQNSEFKSYATVGWGVRSEASESTSFFENITEDSKPIYERRTGRHAEADSIVNLEINRLVLQNKKGEYGSIPGALGETLKEHGYKTALIGSSSTYDTQNTAAGLIAMDFHGFIDYGNVDSTLIQKDAGRPFGIKTNYELLLKEFKKSYIEANFLVIETGDTTRLDRYKENLYPELYEKQKSNILSEIDNFISDIVCNYNEENTKLIIISPYPSNLAISKGERLTPVIIYEGDNKGQILYSGTTRRYGILGNIDIGPTILSYFNLSSDKMTGRTLTSIYKDDNLDYINNLNKRVTNTSIQRYRVLYTFAIYEIITSILALLFIVFKKNLNPKYYKYISSALVGNMLVPFILLILPLFGSTSIKVTYLLLICITIAIVFLVHLISKGDSLNVILYSMALLVFALMFDIVTGQNLIKNSLLGYDPIIGARYYGIGNEYMGILIGAVLVFTTALIEKYSINNYIAIIFYGLVTIIIGFPKLGANVGGTITAVSAFILVSIMLSGQKINIRKLFYIGLAVVFAVCIMALIDLFILENQSHLAGAINQIISNGPVSIYQIIVRKISMNLRIMSVTIWSKVLLSGIVILGILFYKPIGFIKRISFKYPKLAKGWSGIIVACIIGFLVNDSGVVASATSIIFLTSTILYLIIKDLSY